MWWLLRWLQFHALAVFFVVDLSEGAIDIVLPQVERTTYSIRQCIRKSLLMTAPVQEATTEVKSTHDRRVRYVLDYKNKSMSMKTAC